MKKALESPQKNDSRQLYRTGARIETFMCGICHRQYRGQKRKVQKLFALHCERTHGVKSVKISGTSGSNTMASTNGSSANKTCIPDIIFF